MINESEYIYNEINRYVLLLRSENNVEKKQGYLDKITQLNEEHKRLHETK